MPALGDDTLTEEDRLELGIHERAPRPIGDPVDPLGLFDPRTVAIDPREEVVETRSGIEVYRHPETFEIEDQVIGALIAEFRTVGPIKISREDYRSRSALWIDGWETMLGTHARKAVPHGS